MNHLQGEKNIQLQFATECTWSVAEIWKGIIHHDSTCFHNGLDKSQIRHSNGILCNYRHSSYFWVDRWQEQLAA